MDKQSMTVAVLLFSAALGYLAVRRAADLNHWGQYVSMLCVMTLAAVAIPSRGPVEYAARNNAAPTLSSLDEDVFAAIQNNFVALRQQRERSQ